MTVVISRCPPKIVRSHSRTEHFVLVPEQSRPHGDQSRGTAGAQWRPMPLVSPRPRASKPQVRIFPFSPSMCFIRRKPTRGELEERFTWVIEVHVDAVLGVRSLCCSRRLALPRTLFTGADTGKCPMSMLSKDQIPLGGPADRCSLLYRLFRTRLNSFPAVGPDGSGP
jgi:hypothetical protein